MIKNEKLEYKKFDKSMNEPLSLSYFPDEKIQIVIAGEDVGYVDSYDFAEKITPYLDWKDMQAFMAVSRSYFLAGVDFFNLRDEKIAERVEKAFEKAIDALDHAVRADHHPQQLECMLEMMMTQMWKGTSTKYLLGPFQVNHRSFRSLNRSSKEKAECVEFLLDYLPLNVVTGLSCFGLGLTGFIAMIWAVNHPEDLFRFKTPAIVLSIIMATGLCVSTVNYLRKKIGYDKCIEEKIKARGFLREAKLLDSARSAPETPADSNFRCAAQSLMWHQYGPPPKYKALADSIREELTLESGPGGPG